MERLKKLTEYELWELAIEVQKVLEFSFSNGEVYATLNGKNIKTGVKPKKIVNNCVKKLDISDYFIEGHYTKKSYIEELAGAYTLPCYRLTDEETGVITFQTLFYENIEKVKDLKSALKLIEKNISKILKDEIQSDIQVSLDYDREKVLSIRGNNRNGRIK